MKEVLLILLNLSKINMLTEDIVQYSIYTALIVISCVQIACTCSVMQWGLNTFL